MKSIKELVEEREKDPAPTTQHDYTTDEEFQERQYQLKRQDLIHGSNLPKRHQEAFEIGKTPLDHPWAKALAVIGSKVDSKKGPTIGICGIRGNGKTQLAVSLSLSVIAKLLSCYYTTATSFFSRVKASYSNKSETTEDIIAELRSFKLLTIDEIGKRSDSPWENNLLFELINHRYNDMKPTILIDNRSKEDFLAGVGPSIASRMQETGGVIEASWESFRK